MVLSFASEHPYIFLSVLIGGFCFLYALISSVAKSIADVKINKTRCKQVDSALNKGYEYIELGDMVLQKHDENVKEREVPPKQEQNNNIINFYDFIKNLRGGASQ